MTAITLTPSEDAEVSFISGVNADGTVAAQSFWTWSSDDPATYTSNYQAKWGQGAAGVGATITYSFASASHWTATEENAFRAAMALWSEVANVSFTQVSTGGDFTITRGTDKSAEGGITSYYPGAVGTSTLGTAAAASLSVDTSVAGFGPIGGSFSVYGGYPWTTIIHELGHVIGLGHAGPYDDGVTTTDPSYGTYDTQQWSLMSYNPPSSSWVGDQGDLTPVTPMAMDILAAQRLYGAPVNTPLSGGQTFGFHSNISGPTAPFFDFTQNTQPIVTLWDAGGGNTLDFSGFTSSSTINLNPGTFSSSAGLTNNIGIAFGTEIDTAIGDSSRDFIFANNDGDVLTGGGGGDTIYGGTGYDTFKDTMANQKGEELYNLHAGDVIDFTDASSSTFNYHFGGLFLQYGTGDVSTPNSGDMLTFGTSFPGSFIEKAAPGGGVDLVLRSAAPADFNGDGHSDILWQDTSGDISSWLVSGGGPGSWQLTPDAAYYGAPGSGWQTQGTMDLDGDGHADVLWRNASTGAVSVWLANGSGGFTPGSYTSGPVDLNWSLAGTGDFNGDGKDDLLWRNPSTGGVSEWRSTGSGFNANTFYATVDSSWHVQGVGDFDGDGLADILWRNADGRVSVWTSTGSGFNENAFNATAPTNWHVAGVGDFNGDGRADILWQDGQGDVSEWQSTGSGWNENTFYASVDPAWRVAAIGDFDGDGKADILWRNTDGSFSIWTSTGAGFNEGAYTHSSVGTNWNILNLHPDII